MQSIELNSPIKKASFISKSRKSLYLSTIFFGYLYFLFFIGRFIIFQQAVIWVLGPIVVFIVMVSYVEKPFSLPKEIFVYTLFWLWTLTGYLIAIDLGPFLRYFRLIFTILVLIICTEIVLMKTGSITAVFKLYIMIGLSYFVYDVITGKFSTNLVGEEGWRYGGLISDSNWNAFMAFTALTGVCFFWRSSKVFARKVLLGFLLSLFIGSVILSASRGGFITTLVFMAVWIVLTNLKQFRKRRFLYIGLIIVSIPILIIAYDFLMANTFLGERFSSTIDPESEVTDEKRVQLYIQAFEIFVDNPIWGIGLSQFLVMTNYVAFTHSDYMELLSTTGFVGFALMMIFYSMIFMKVLKLRKKLKSEVLLYRMNLFVAIMVAILIYGFFYTNFVNIMSLIQFSIIGGYSNYLERKLIEYDSYLQYKKMKLQQS